MKNLGVKIQRAVGSGLVAAGAITAVSAMGSETPAACESSAGTTHHGRHGSFDASCTNTFRIDLRATRTTSAAGPKRPVHVEITTMDSAARQELNDAWVQWVADMKMRPAHQKWHNKNGTGGQQGRKSGEKFLQFHWHMLEDFKAHLRESGKTHLLGPGGTLPTWDTKKDLPDEFSYEGQRRKNINFSIPTWATVKGTKKKDEFSELDDRTIRSLNDLRTVDEVGRAIGERFHARGHVRLGGKMAGFSSVELGAFLLWHGKIDEVREAWLVTQSGQAWLKKHPTGWTDASANSHGRSSGHAHTS